MMRVLILLGAVSLLAACQSPAASAAEGGTTMSIKMQLDKQVFSVTLANTPAARAFANRLPVSLQMSELNGNKKYAYLDAALPAAPQSVGKVAKGDIMLFGKDCLVLFYEAFSTSYRYTPVGRVDNPSALPDLSRQGNVSVVFSN